MLKIAMDDFFTIQANVLNYMLQWDNNMYSEEYAEQFPDVSAHQACLIVILKELTAQLSQNLPIQADVVFSVEVFARGCWVQERFSVDEFLLNAEDLISNQATQDRLMQYAKAHLMHVYTQTVLDTIRFESFKIEAFKVPDID